MGTVAALILCVAGACAINSVLKRLDVVGRRVRVKPSTSGALGDSAALAEFQSPGYAAAFADLNGTYVIGSDVLGDEAWALAKEILERGPARFDRRYGKAASSD